MINNKKGQVGIGLLVTVAIAIIVGLILFQSVAQNVGTTTQSSPVVAVNTTITGVLNTPVELPGQELVSVQAVVNATQGTAVAAANYTIAECVKTSNNLKGICYTATGVGSPAATGLVKVSYTYYADGYIEDSGARSISGLITILTAIALMLVAFIGIRKLE